MVDTTPDWSFLDIEYPPDYDWFEAVYFCKITVDAMKAGEPRLLDKCDTDPTLTGKWKGHKEL
jgi:hypothetical protein